MAWRQLTLTVDAKDLRKAESLLELAGALAVSIHDAADDPVLEPKPGETPFWPSSVVQALFAADRDLEAVATLLRGALTDSTELKLTQLDDADWQRAWRQRVEARRFGSRLELVPAEESGEHSSAAAVRLHMGLAFGTGEHPTTSLCLEWLDAVVAPGDRILDYGCGSGVLSLAALKLGAEFAWAVDNDPQALQATADNMRLNDMDADSIWTGLPDALPELQAELIVANILAGPLENIAETLYRCSASNGRIALSGILDAQRDRIERTYAPYFVNFAGVSRDGWLRLSAQRKSAP